MSEPIISDETVTAIRATSPVLAIFWDRYEPELHKVLAAAAPHIIAAELRRMADTPESNGPWWALAGSLRRRAAELTGTQPDKPRERPMYSIAGSDFLYREDEHGRVEAARVDEPTQWGTTGWASLAAVESNLGPLAAVPAGEQDTAGGA